MYKPEFDRGVMCHDYGQWCKSGRGIELSVELELDNFWSEHSKIWNICNLIGCFWPKYIMFELRKDIGVMFDVTKDSCKIWRKTDLPFIKWHKEYSFTGWKIVINRFRKISKKTI